MHTYLVITSEEGSLAAAFLSFLSAPSVLSPSFWVPRSAGRQGDRP